MHTACSGRNNPRGKPTACRFCSHWQSETSDLQPGGFFTGWALTSKTTNPRLGIHGRFRTSFADEEPPVGLAEESWRRSSSSEPINPHAFQASPFTTFLKRTSAPERL